MKVKIGFKSGREITLRGIQDITISYNDEQITKINIKHTAIGNFLANLGFLDRLFVASINLASIDYIIRKQ